MSLKQVQLFENVFTALNLQMNKRIEESIQATILYTTAKLRPDLDPMAVLHDFQEEAEQHVKALFKQGEDS